MYLYARLTLLLFLAMATYAQSQEQASTLPTTTPIDAYVKASDEVYEWSVVQSSTAEGVESVAIDLVSQRWLTTEEVDRPLWQHRLLLAIPESLYETDIGFLYISGGSNAEESRTEASGLIKEMALATNTVIAELRMVPNQPLEFHGDGRSRWEDDLIAYAWVQYLTSGDPDWLPRNAMIKSAVRAMDAIQEFMSSHRQGQHPINRFTVAGGSKRGWTTWMTGAMDDRVVAMVPMVIDVLSVDASMRHHFAAYGFYAPSIGDYVNHGIMQWIGTPELAQLYAYVDPYSYIQRLEMPKFVVNASGDQFFLPDSSQFYWADLPSSKYLRYVPNAEHSLGGSDALESVTSFHFLVTRNLEIPEMAWSYVNSAQVAIEFDRPPQSLHIWEAHNAYARDFRVETFGRGYVSREIDVPIDTDLNIEVSVETPSTGWRAWFVEASFDVGFVRPLKLTTEVKVIPETLPFNGKPPNLETSLTFLVHDEQISDEFFTEVKGLLETAGVGKQLSITTQRQTTFINFVPTVEPRVAMSQFAGFLYERFGEDVSANVQLESGPDATLNPN